MKNKTKLIFSAAIAAGLLALPRVQAANSEEPALTPPAATAGASTNDMSTNTSVANTMTELFGDPVIAQGKGFEVKQSELDEAMVGIRSFIESRGGTITPAELPVLQGQALDELIQVQLLLQKATDADKAEGKKEADDKIAALRKAAGSDEALDAQLKAAGTTLDQLQAKVTQDATASVALQRLLNVTVSNSEIEQYYTNHPTDFEQPEQAHVRHILLLKVDMATHAPLPDDQIQAKQQQIEDILKKVRAGGDFAQLAEQYSEDQASKDKGGELDPMSSDQMDYLFGPEFEAAAFSLTNNQISDVVTTPYGFDIIQLLDKTPSKQLTLTDTVPQTGISVSDAVKDFLTRQKVNKSKDQYLAGLKKEADVQILDPDLKAAMEAAESAATNMPPDAASSDVAPQN
ncbi:MAG TPA: peptidylprolyl isomerase [Verrucomicrobiae bacterium]|nr:peptidylprolyl isomerase [Verrucomicrobiae bacterium]